MDYTYTYKVRKIRPKDSFLSIVYEKVGYPSVIKNFTTTNFTPESVDELVKSYAVRVREYWENYDIVADSDNSYVSEGYVDSDIAIKTITLDKPFFDETTEKLEEVITYDSDTQINVVSWNIIDLTAEEQIDYRINNTFKNLNNPEAQAKAVEVIIQKTISLDDLSDNELAAVSKSFTPWTIDEFVAIDTIRQYDGIAYKAVQEHTTSYLWPPDITPALWTPVRQPLSPWVQPLGAQDAYNTGERVTHDNPNDGGNIWVYESTIDSNTNEPGRDGELDRWWTPIEPA